MIFEYNEDDGVIYFHGQVGENDKVDAGIQEILARMQSEISPDDTYPTATEASTALERGETKPQQEPPKYKGATCRGSYVLGTACGLCERCEDEKRRMVVASKPTPATVERFRSRMFRFDAPMTWSWYGDVRATLGGMVDDKWCVDLPGGVRLNLTEIEYRALVDMMLKSGVWERQV